MAVYLRQRLLKVNTKHLSSGSALVVQRFKGSAGGGSGVNKIAGRLESLDA
jgi:hypothetical protein